MCTACHLWRHHRSSHSSYSIAYEVDIPSHSKINKNYTCVTHQCCLLSGISVQHKKLAHNSPGLASLKLDTHLCTAYRSPSTVLGLCGESTRDTQITQKTLVQKRSYTTILFDKNGMAEVVEQDGRKTLPRGFVNQTSPLTKSKSRVLKNKCQKQLSFGPVSRVLIL